MNLPQHGRLGRMFFIKLNIYMIIKLLGFVPLPNLRHCDFDGRVYDLFEL